MLMGPKCLNITWYILPSKGNEAARCFFGTLVNLKDTLMDSEKVVFMVMFDAGAKGIVW